MKLQNQVCSLKLAKKLKKLGVKQESLFWWNRTTKRLYPSKIVWAGSAWISAFTVAELGEMLPAIITKTMSTPFSRTDRIYWLGISREWNTSKGKDWTIHYTTQESKGHTLEVLYDKSEANLRAKMLIYLLENKLTK